ncbi:MAG: hypothetical protein JXQ29_02365 [Planctomycetes bacterium]|nr:hypothetical protein [Planctomycetota bacterium]
MMSWADHPSTAVRAGRVAVRAAALACAVATLLGLGAPAAPAGAVHGYEVRVGPKVPGPIHIRMVLQEVPAGEVRLARAEPEERPGRRGAEVTVPLSDLVVTDAAGKPLPFESSGARCWIVRPQGARTLHVSYDVALEFTGKDDVLGLLFDPREALLYWVGREADPARLRLELPRGWKAASGLKSGKPAATFEAPDLEALFGSPLLLGPLHRTDFKLKGAVFSLVFHRRPDFDPHAVVARLKPIAQYQLGLFGVLPFERYAFLVLLQDERQWLSASGQACSSIYALSPCAFGATAGRRGAGRDAGRDPAHDGADSGAAEDGGAAGDRGVEGLFARELFRAWNSHFIRPLNPESATAVAAPARTRARWFTRGVSEYYAQRTLLKTGLAGEGRLLDEAARHLRYLEESPDYGQVSVARASWEDGTGSYPRQRRGVSPVSAGFLLGLILDIELLEHTRGTKSLDDVMKFLGWWFGTKQTGFNDNADLEKAVSTVAEHDFAPFFARHVEGTERLPVEETLGRIGYVVERRERTAPCPYQFLRHLSRAGLQTTTGWLRAVDEDNCLHAAGLRSGDRLVGILDVTVRDHKDMNALARAFLATWRRRAGSGTQEPVTVTYRRDSKLLKTAIALPSVSRKTVAFVPAPATGPGGQPARQAAYIRNWLAPAR